MLNKILYRLIIVSTLSISQLTSAQNPTDFERTLAGIDGTGGTNFHLGIKKEDEMQPANSKNKNNASIKELHGIISSLDKNKKRFLLNGLIIDYGNIVNLPKLIDGISITIQGKFDQKESTLFIADKITIVSTPDHFQLDK